MRLTTLARKINISPGQLIEFLEKNDKEVSNGQHTKLDHETIDMVMDHFMPEHKVETTEAPSEIQVPEAEKEDESADSAISKETEPGELAEDTVPEMIEIPEAKVNTPEIKIDTPEEKIVTPEANDTIEQGQGPRSGTIEDLENEEDIDLIRVKKVKLEGIKVVGKIDLPEKPKKEVAETDQGEDATSDTGVEPAKRTPSRGRKFDRNRKKNRKQHGRRSLSYEEKLKEEEREKLKMRRRRENEEKRRKTKYYEKNIKPKIASAPKKKHKKKTDNFQSPQPEISIHKNPLIRFWEWLNGKYDRY
jgi:hypothetical protein